ANVIPHILGLEESPADFHAISQPLTDGRKVRDPKKAQRGRRFSSVGFGPRHSLSVSVHCGGCFKHDVARLALIGLAIGLARLSEQDFCQVPHAAPYVRPNRNSTFFGSCFPTA